MVRLKQIFFAIVILGLFGSLALGSTAQSHH